MCTLTQSRIGRLNFLDGQISAHCSVLNNDARMKIIKLTNDMAAALADIYNDKNEERERARARKEKEEAEKEQRQMSRSEKEKEAKKEGLKTCNKLMAELKEKGAEHIRTFNVAPLKSLIRYQFKLDAYKQSGIRKAELIKIAIELYRKHAKDNKNENDEASEGHVCESDVTNVEAI